MNVNYEYYRLFYYVCKYHSITRAANVLRMSQPNVTRALNRLEEQLGCKLLVRSTRGVTMTPEGEVLFAHVEIAQEQLQAGESELAGITALESGALTISASETALNVFLLDKLREFHRRYPGVRLRIANHSTPQAIRALGRGLVALQQNIHGVDFRAIRALGRGLVDLCVITTPARLESTMRRTLLMPFQEILIAGRDFEFLQGRRWALKELQQYPLICLGSETMTYAFYNQFYLSNNLVLQPDTEAATTDQVVPLVKSGLGLGYVPQNFAKDALAAGDVFTIQLKEEIPTRHVVLVQDGGRVPNAAAREFARMLNSSVTQQNAP